MSIHVVELSIVLSWYCPALDALPSWPFQECDEGASGPAKALVLADKLRLLHSARRHDSHCKVSKGLSIKSELCDDPADHEHCCIGQLLLRTKGCATHSIQL